MDKRIELSGFRDIDEPSLDLVHRNIGNHLRRLEEITKKLERLHITLKRIHVKEKSEKYEIHAKLLDDGKPYFAEVTDRNLLAAVDNVLHKVANEIKK